MTITYAELADTDHPADFRRDQWGRPSIMQPDGKRKGYTRCSSAAKTIEDTFNLEKWARRNVAYGLAYDSSLVARIIAIGGEPSTWGKAEKDQVNAILEAADAVAKAHKRADIGTAVHHLTHRLDRGETVNGGPYQADLDAYLAAMKAANLATEERFIECRMVNDELEMAGTADRIVWNGDRYIIADIKTGSTIDFGSLGWAAQEAAYAGGVLYDPVTEQRLDTPTIDREVGLIIHLPAGEGRCTIYEVDIAAGLEAAQLANQIRATRKASKGWMREHRNSSGSQPAVEADPLDQAADSAADGATTCSVARAGVVPVGSAQPTPPSAVAAAAEPSRRASLLARYQAMSDDEKLAYMELGIPKTAADDEIQAGLEKVDRFNVVVQPPAPILRAVPELGIRDREPLDEGGTVAAADIAALQARFEKLPLDGSLWTGRLVAEGNRAFPFRIKDAPTVRRYELYRGILLLAETFYGGAG